ncbi:MAG TPA: hypothetical protein VH120_00475 [Gemmataceae bacterium]|jgi:hypothetical protein|nr:hypothetical protein [Gemmataceae bacterium]
MKNTDWIDLLRLIPEEQHNILVLTTLTGVDLNVETILRTEESYVVFRGRVSGITDEGRVFFVPYRQIDFLQINRTVKEAEIRRMYGDSPEPEAERAAQEESSPASSGVFSSIAATSGSRQGLTISPATPSAPAPAVPSRPSLPGTVARLSTGTATASPSKHPQTPANGNDGPTPPRNSILERLRAQRNSVVVTKPLGK